MEASTGRQRTVAASGNRLRPDRPTRGSPWARAAAAARNDVVELDLVGGAADAASVDRPLAPPAVPLPDRPLHVRGHVVRLRSARLAPWLIHGALRFSCRSLR